MFNFWLLDNLRFVLQVKRGFSKLRLRLRCRPHQGERGGDAVNHRTDGAGAT